MECQYNNNQDDVIEIVHEVKETITENIKHPLKGKRERLQRKNVFYVIWTYWLHPGLYGAKAEVK